jgi:hypothetical protein
MPGRRKGRGMHDFWWRGPDLRACRKVFGVHGSLGIPADLAPPILEGSMILSTIAAKLKRRSKDDFRGRHFEAALIVQTVSWYLRYPLSYRDIEELFLERDLEVDHSPSVTSAQRSTTSLLRNSITAGSCLAGWSTPTTAVATIMSQRSWNAIASADFAVAPRPPRA